MTANEILTLVMSGLSLLVSITVCFFTWRKDRIRLRLVPGFVLKSKEGVPAVCQTSLPKIHSGCEIQGFILDVVNLGTRSATIYEVGFRVRNSGKNKIGNNSAKFFGTRIPFMEAKTTLGGKSLPVKLDSADRVSFSIPINQFAGVASIIVDAYVSTGCGNFFFGNNDALKDFCSGALQ